jgi:hypothetical protein
MAETPPITYRGPFLGLNTTGDPGSIGLAFARTARNIVLSDGMIRSRRPWRPIRALDLSASRPSFTPAEGDVRTPHILGLTCFGDASGQTNTIAKVLIPTADDLWRPELWSFQDRKDPQLLLSTVWLTHDLPTFVYVKGMVYIYDGGAVLWKTDGTASGTVRQGIRKITDRSIQFVDFQEGGVGAVVSYVATAYDSVRNVESNYNHVYGPATIGSTVAVRFLLFSALEDHVWRESGADTLRIYRRNHSAGNVGHRLIHEQPWQSTQTHWVDRLAENEIELSSDVTGPFAPSRNGSPQKATCAALFGSRMFMNDVDNPGILRFSAIATPEHVHPDDWLDVSGDGDDVVRGLQPVNDVLYVGKRGGIWAVSGDIQTATNETAALGAVPLDSNERVYPTNATTGPSNEFGNGLTKAGEPARIYFGNEAGVFRFDGLEERLVSDLITPTWREITKPYGKPCVTFAEDPQDKLLLICVGRGVGWGAIPTPMALYHYGVNRGDGVGIFATADAGGIHPKLGEPGVTCVTRFVSPIDHPAHPQVHEGRRHTPYMVGTDLGYVLLADEHWVDDDAFVPEMTYETGLLELTPGRRTHLRHVKWFMSRAPLPTVGTGFAMIGWALMDGRWDRESTKLLRYGDDIVVMPVRRTGRSVQLVLSKLGTWKQGFKRELGVLGFELAIEPVGQR